MGGTQKPPLKRRGPPEDPPADPQTASFCSKRSPFLNKGGPSANVFLLGLTGHPADATGYMYIRVYVYAVEVLWCPNLRVLDSLWCVQFPHITLKLVVQKNILAQSKAAGIRI